MAVKKTAKKATRKPAAPKMVTVKCVVHNVMTATGQIYKGETIETTLADAEHLVAKKMVEITK